MNGTRCLLVLGLCVAASVRAAAQSESPCQEIDDATGYTVQSVRVVGRWVPDDLRSRVEQIANKDQPFSNAALSRAQEAVADYLAQSEASISLHVLGATSVMVISPSLCDVSKAGGPRQVAIVIRPFYIRIDLMNIGGNVLPIPRSAAPTFYENVPKPLVALNPFFAVQSDRQLGESLAFQTTTDFLNPPSKVARGAAQASKLSLMLNGQRSIDTRVLRRPRGPDIRSP